MNEAQIILGLNLWLNRYIENPQAFEAEFQTVSKHLDEAEQLIPRATDVTDWHI